MKTPPISSSSPDTSRALYGIRTRDRWLDIDTAQEWRTVRTSENRSLALDSLRYLRAKSPLDVWQLWETVPGCAPVMVEGYN